MKSACMVWFSLVQTALYSEIGLPAVSSCPRAVWRKNAVRTVNYRVRTAFFKYYCLSAMPIS
ncbi:hypothetical protein EYL39_02990 [Neisseria gonorrhoeae]|nr:hypothetical protein EGH17_00200 [Neisseria gonorrhoeae]TJW38498.1 hypothetical protein E8M73_01805 [Neisseria gonorrhoeae]TJW74465.1 hypothetical protein E8M72_01305 [Neisseria gonorrhoeae]TND34985.1 hypothetical protein EPH43_01055 [Neisseria gonorrhoeae]TND47428.1 hypothetical protein EPH40_04750 [Neisseria gonorrhoeae]